VFRVGDRVRLAPSSTWNESEPVGTAAGFVTPDFAPRLAAPDDVIVPWDSGLEMAVLIRVQA
jgi:hypothetical protein